MVHELVERIELHSGLDLGVSAEYLGGVEWERGFADFLLAETFLGEEV